jgi:hypothetical protein
MFWQPIPACLFSQWDSGMRTQKKMPIHQRTGMKGVRVERPLFSGGGASLADD